MASKEKERIYAESAARLLGQTWQLVEIPEPVDFEVRSSGAIFGLEVRQVFADTESSFGSPARRQENENQKLAASMARLYVAQGGKPATVRLVGDLRGVASEDLVRQAIAHCPTEVFGKSRFQHGHLTVHISALPPDHEPPAWWLYVNDHVGWVRDATKEELQHAIDRKLDRLPSYKQKYARIDLLLVADRTLNSGRMRLAENLRVSNPGFHAIYFLSYPEAAIRVA
jgi:hypothetical protein